MNKLLGILLLILSISGPVLADSRYYDPSAQTTLSVPNATTGTTYYIGGTQTHTILTSSPTGCTGGSPVLSQSCSSGSSGNGSGNAEIVDTSGCY